MSLLFTAGLSNVYEGDRDVVNIEHTCTLRPSRVQFIWDK